jgi:preprotein translocase subunit SecA
VEDLEALSSEALVEQCLAWAEDAYWKMNRRLGEEMYRAIRQQEIPVRVLLEADDPFYHRVANRLRETLDLSEMGTAVDQPVRRLSSDLEAKVRDAVVAAHRLFRDRRLMIREIDEHWVRHLTSLDMLREGIGLRAVGQQNPLVAYQKEAFEMYQEMLGSIQSQIVRNLFLVPPVAVTSRRRRSPAPSPTQESRQRQLSFRAAGGSSAGQSQPAPHRSSDKPGRNDPCWCGSGKKYKDCHWREDRKAAARSAR